MDLKQSERYYHGYIFMPCCTEDHSYFHNQLQGYQAMSSSYPSPVSKCDAIFRTQSEHQATYTSRFTSHSGDHRLFFPATQRERQPQRCEVSRHKISVESLPERPLLRGNNYNGLLRVSMYFPNSLLINLSLAVIFVALKSGLI